MISHSVRVMRQSNQLFKLKRIKSITGAIKNEESNNNTSLNSSNHQADTQSHLPQNPYTQQPQHHHFYHTQQPYPQQHPQHQFTHNYSTSAATNTKCYSQSRSSTPVTIKPTPFRSTAVKLTKLQATPPVLLLSVPNTTTVEDEKTSLKPEKEIRAEYNPQFKEYLDTLPSLNHPKHYKVDCVRTSDEANKRLAQLVKEDERKVFGVDLEWPPCFNKGQRENKTSLVQICSAKRILLIQLSSIKGFPPELRRFFEDKTLLKSGVNIAADGLKINRDFGIRTNGLVELRDLAEISKSPKLGITHLRSLRALTGIFMDQNMVKGKVRISNWARPNLTALQVKYAALDAYASYQLYVILDGLRDKKETITVRHLIEDIPVTKDEKKEEVEKKLQQQQTPTSNHTLNNRSSPTSTVTIVKKKESDNGGNK